MKKKLYYEMLKINYFINTLAPSSLEWGQKKKIRDKCKDVHFITDILINYTKFLLDICLYNL